MGPVAFRVRLKQVVVDAKYHLWGRVGSAPYPTQTLGLHWASSSGTS